jgi:hypothetical protein
MLVEPPKNLYQGFPLAAFLLRKSGSGAALFGSSNSPVRRKEVMGHCTKNIVFAVLALVLGACSPKIYGTVQLVDANLQPIPATKESPQGTVVNMINTTTTLEKASQAISVNAEGKYESIKDYILPGIYKVEASRIGFMTETQTVEVTKFGRKKADFKLKKIPEGKRKSIEGSKSDEDKIVNPGEVNIQPPTM